MANWAKVSESQRGEGAELHGGLQTDIVAADEVFQSHCTVGLLGIHINQPDFLSPH